MDELLAKVSTPESAKKRFNSTRSQGSKVALAIGSAIEPGGACSCSLLSTGVVEQRAKRNASAVVPAERLDAHQSAVVKQLLQWGRGGLAPSLMRERAMLLHRVLEVSRYLTPLNAGYMGVRLLLSLWCLQCFPVLPICEYGYIYNLHSEGKLLSSRYSIQVLANCDYFCYTFRH